MVHSTETTGKDFSSVGQFGKMALSVDTNGQKNEIFYVTKGKSLL